MTHRLVSLLFGALLVAGLCACPATPGPTPEPGDTTLRLNRLSNGDLEFCDAAGQCQELPYDGDCAAIEIDVDTTTGATCERCILDDGTSTGANCSGGSVACVLVTLPDPDCVVCAFVDGSVIYSTCSTQTPDDCRTYVRPDGVTCEECYSAEGDIVLDSCGPDCSMVGCPAVECGPGYEHRLIPGECCGQCVPIDGCDEVVCSQELAIPACPQGTELVRDPADCCSYVCQPTSCAGSSTSGGGAMPPPPQDGCSVDSDCGFGAWCDGGFCTYDEVNTCPPGYFWDDSYPACGRCIPYDPDPNDYCYTHQDCELSLGSEYYCAFDDGTCVGTDVPDGSGFVACAGVCRARDPICASTGVSGDPGVAVQYRNSDLECFEGVCEGGICTTADTVASCEGFWEIAFDANGCAYPICMCPDGIITADGRCFDQCANVTCFAPPPECEPGLHVEYGYPNCCGRCVPDDVCAYLDSGADPTDPNGVAWVCPDAPAACSLGFHVEQGPDCCPVCVPDAERACGSDVECLPGERCDASVCLPPPGCDPAAGDDCATVCYGQCIPAEGCIDPDGIDPFVQGEVRGPATDPTDPVFVDTCDTDGLTVIEFYCADAVGGSAVDSLRIECPNGCRLGACF